MRHIEGKFHYVHFDIGFEYSPVLRMHDLRCACRMVNTIDGDDYAVANVNTFEDV